jgi:hypothetical protein
MLSFILLDSVFFIGSCHLNLLDRVARHESPHWPSTSGVGLIDSNVIRLNNNASGHPIWYDISIGTNAWMPAEPGGNWLITGVSSARHQTSWQRITKHALQCNYAPNIQVNV